MRKILTLILLFTCLVCTSQKKKQNPPLTIRGNIGIPKVISSKMFKTAFSAVVQGYASVNYRLFDNFYVGLGYEYCSFANNKKEWSAQFITSKGAVYYKTNLTGHGGFLKFGYDYFFSDIGYVSYSLNSGYMTLNYRGALPDSSAANKPYVSKVFSAPYIEPELSVNFLAERAVSFSVFLSYTTLVYHFDPKAPRFNNVGAIRDARNNYFMSWINIGFGFNILINSK